MDQRTHALQLANVERSAKAALKRQIKNGEVNPVDVILHTEHSFTVAELLRAVPRCGPTVAATIARQAQVTESKRVVDLHTVQRKQLAVVLGRRLEERADRSLYGRRYRNPAAA